jgi:hypothetical protein
MSEAVKLSSKLGKEEQLNGLDSRAEDLVVDDSQTLCALVWMQVEKTTKSRKSGKVVPTVEIVRIEPLASPENLPGAVIEEYFRAYKERTGAQEMLPVGLTEVVEGGYVEAASEER